LIQRSEKKIIESYLAGHGRNQIDRELREQKIKVSHGSISNIINAYKRQYEQPLQSHATISTGIDMNDTGSPPSTPRFSKGKATSTTTTNVVIPRDGGPLSHFLNEEAAAAAAAAAAVNPDSIIITNTTHPAQAIPPTKQPLEICS
jgi:hypothetical protein